MQTHVLARYSRMDHGSHGIESSGLTFKRLGHCRNVRGPASAYMQNCKGPLAY
jgi:hypothetical protein